MLLLAQNVFFSPCSVIKLALISEYNCEDNSNWCEVYAAPYFKSTAQYVCMLLQTFKKLLQCFHSLHALQTLYVFNFRGVLQDLTLEHLCLCIADAETTRRAPMGSALRGKTPDEDVDAWSSWSTGFPRLCSLQRSSSSDSVAFLRSSAETRNLM